jgi:hypothetical protein
MKSRFRKRRLGVESLEARLVLQGNVAASVVDGSLVLVGDALSNGVTVEQIDVAGVPPGAGGGGGGSFRISPDATTSVNGSPIGQPVVVSDVTGDVRCDLGGGDDAFLLLDATSVSLSSLSIETGEGSDVVRISDSSFAGAVAISNSLGDDVLDLRRCLVGDRLTVSSRGSQDISLDQVQAVDAFIKIELGAAGLSSSSRTAILGSEFSGKLSLEAVGKHDFSLQNSRARGAYIKFDGTKGERTVSSAALLDSTLREKVVIFTRGTSPTVSASRMSFSDMFVDLDCPVDGQGAVSLSACDAQGRLEVRSRGQVDVSVASSRTRTRYMKFEALAGQKAPSTLDVVDEDCDGKAEVFSRGALQVTADGIRTAALFMKFDGVPGEAVHSSVSLANSSVGDRLEVASRGGLDFSMGACRAVDMFLKLDGIKGEKSAATVSLTDGTIDGQLVVTGAGASHHVSASRMSLFDVFMKMDAPPGERSAVSVADSQALGRLVIDSRGEADVSLAACRAFDTFLKLTGIRGQAAPSSLAVADLDGDGRLDVVCTGASNISLDRLACDTVSVRESALDPKQRSQVAVRDSSVLSRLAISTRGGADVSVAATDCDDMYLKFESLRSQTAPSTTALSGLVLGGRLDVASRGTNQVSVDRLACAALYMKIEGLSGEDRATVDMGDASVLNRVSLDLRGGADVSVASTRAADMFLKYENTRDQVALSSSHLVDVDLDGRLDVVSVGGHQFAADGLRAKGTHIKIDFLRSDRGRSSVALDNVSLGGSLSVESCPLDFSASQLAAVDMFLKITPLKSTQGAAQPGATVQLTDAALAGRLEMSASSGNDEVSLARVSTAGRLVVNGQSGNDVFTAVDCVFGGASLFDGGRGQDSLTLSACRFASPPTLVSWETVVQDPAGAGG